MSASRRASIEAEGGVSAPSSLSEERSSHERSPEEGSQDPSGAADRAADG